MKEKLKKIVMARKRGLITSLEFLSMSSELVDDDNIHFLDEFSSDELLDVKSVMRYHGVPQDGAMSVNGDPICVSGWRRLANWLLR